MRALGCERQVISAEEAIKIEPALAHIRGQLAGATYTAEDESGDANRFARELVKLCEAAGASAAGSTTASHSAHTSQRGTPPSHWCSRVRKRSGSISEKRSDSGLAQRWESLRGEGRCPSVPI